MPRDPVPAYYADLFSLLASASRRTPGRGGSDPAANPTGAGARPAPAGHRLTNLEEALTHPRVRLTGLPWPAGSDRRARVAVPFRRYAVAAWTTGGLDYGWVEIPRRASAALKHGGQPIDNCQVRHASQLSNAECG